MPLSRKDLETLALLMEDATNIIADYPLDDAKESAFPATKLLNDAAKLLRKAKTTWTEVLLNRPAASKSETPPSKANGGVLPSSTPDWNITDYTDEEIENAFDDLMSSSMSETFAAFIDSLYAKWQDDHILSPKQLKALLEGAERARDAPPF
jgi:hypothetical protein